MCVCVYVSLPMYLTLDKYYGLQLLSFLPFLPRLTPPPLSSSVPLVFLPSFLLSSLLPPLFTFLLPSLSPSSPPYLLFSINGFSSLFPPSFPWTGPEADCEFVDKQGLVGDWSQTEVTEGRKVTCALGSLWVAQCESFVASHRLAFVLSLVRLTFLLSCPYISACIV